jgi:hypothetical protein
VNEYMASIVRQGELGAARGALERSGESIEAMAHKFTQYIDNITPNASREQQNSPETTQ